MYRRIALSSGLGVLLAASTSFAQNYEVLDQQLDASGEGYTVLRVWGTHDEIGFAIGVAFADELVDTADDIRAYAGNEYGMLRAAMGMVAWVPDGADAEFEGIAQGVKSVRPNADFDAVDIKVANTFGDWAYPPACRSHSCWGPVAEAPYTTISTRRLDFESLLPVMHHHVLYVVEPAGDAPRWVNLAWPGFVSVVTGVNEYGTVVSIHDFNSKVTTQPGVVSRSMAARSVLSSVPDTPVSDHLSWAQQELSSFDVATGTFINFYAPDGHGGVFTCAAGSNCGAPRTPQGDYLGGHVLITTNSQTDGHSTPYGASFLDGYYAQPGPKTVESHFDVMVDAEMHMLTVGFRERGDMRLLAHGRTYSGWTSRLDLEWSSLFSAEVPDAGVPDASPEPDATVDADAAADVFEPLQDGGVGGSGGSVGDTDAGAQGPGSGSAGDGISDDDEGCSCSMPGRMPGRAGGWAALALALAACARFGRRRYPSSNQSPKGRNTQSGA